MARLAKATKTQASRAADSRLEELFCRDQVMVAAGLCRTDSEVLAEAFREELQRRNLAERALPALREAADQEVLAGQLLHFEAGEEAEADREGAAHRRKASRRFMACNACCGKESTACARASTTSTAIQ